MEECLDVGLRPAAVNPATAARLVSVSRSTIYRWMEIPGFPVFRVGGVRPDSGL